MEIALEKIKENKEWELPETLEQSIIDLERLRLSDFKLGRNMSGQETDFKGILCMGHAREVIHIEKKNKTTLLERESFIPIFLVKVENAQKKLVGSERENYTEDIMKALSASNEEKLFFKEVIRGIKQKAYNAKIEDIAKAIKAKHGPTERQKEIIVAIGKMYVENNQEKSSFLLENKITGTEFFTRLENFCALRSGYFPRTIAKRDDKEMNKVLEEALIECNTENEMIELIDLCRKGITQEAVEEAPIKASA